MITQRNVFLLALGVLITSSLFGQAFSPRKDFVWARDVAGATMTVDGKLTEAAWAQAESAVVQYGGKSGNAGDGWKVMNGTGAVTNGANAVLKFLTDKSKNMLYIAVIAKDSSVGGFGWENSDGILGGIYDRKSPASTGVSRHRDIFLIWGNDSASSVKGATNPRKDGDLVNAGIVTYAGSVVGTSNSDTIGAGTKVADTSWVIELGVSLDSLSYNANSVTTEVIQMSMGIWDQDWPSSSASHVATKSWWENEWGNNGGASAARVLVRSDVTINSGTLPTYAADRTVPNGANFPNVAVDGDLKDSIWAYVPYFDIQWDGTAFRTGYGPAGKDRSGQWLTTSGKTVVDGGRCRVKMFFKGDTLYVGADVNDQAISSGGAFAYSDDKFDGVQVNMTIPIDSLRDGVSAMASRRFGAEVDSASKAYRNALWDAVSGNQLATGYRYGVNLKPSSTVDNPSNVDAGYTVEMAFDLTKFGYTAGQTNKTVAVGVDYHDVDRTTTDTAAYRTWWFREWPWAATAAFCLLDNSTLLTTTDVAQVGGPPREFAVFNNFPNPFNPSTTIRYTLPEQGRVRILIYDVLGRLVSLKDFGEQSNGQHEYRFSASGLASAVYFYNVEFSSSQTGERRISDTKKLMLLK